MKSELIKFYSTDDIILDGYINKSESKTEKILIAIHGMTSNCLKKREKVIAENIAKLNIDTLCFNNRGSEIIRYCKRRNGSRVIQGTAFEDVEEGYFDILGAIKYAIDLGYKQIFLQGHSLGSTKIVYTYTKLKRENSIYLKYIKGILLLSLIDIPDMFNTFAPKEYIKKANEIQKENKQTGLILLESDISPLSIKTFLKYIKYNENIDFARYSEENYNFKELNDIDVPLFMRWGNDRELIKQKAEELVEFLQRKINKKDKDIDYINGANHSYNGKEEIVANQVCSFLEKYK